MRTLITWIKKAFLPRRKETAEEDEPVLQPRNLQLSISAGGVDTGQQPQLEKQHRRHQSQEDEPVLPPHNLQLSISAGGVDTGQQLQLEKQHRRHQSQQMLLTLREMERNGMDPLIAAFVYNMKHSPIHRLPDEIMLQILRCLGDDPLTMLCLRRVATRFRRIIYEPEIWKVFRLGVFSIPGYVTECLVVLPEGVKDELLRRVYVDGMCDECTLRHSVPPRRHGICPAVSSSSLSLHCNDCERVHSKTEHLCPGRNGVIRLCQHVNISWADIEPYLSKRQHNSFSIECHDPSHNLRCRADVPPTWPRARLRIEGIGQHLYVVLTLTWMPHSVVSLTSEGRIPASEMRRIFQRYRQSAADIIFPSWPHLPLPEM
ncbi:hypothetical protein B0T24DRAFT_586556, partial [Lasiosphaeria ovina]